jgi:hypothetical protein
MGLGLKQSLRAVHSLGSKEELYGFILQEALTENDGVTCITDLKEFCKKGRSYSEPLKKRPQNVGNVLGSGRVIKIKSSIC